MTDGIIQEVFNQYRNRVLIDYKTLESIKQQLIEKIKQALDLPTGNKELDTYVIETASIELKKLIGDNQE